jgi:V/A-type H+-transporting ATPase subunit F
MKMFVIADNLDTLTGMRMVGVQGCVVRTEAEFKKAIDEVVATEDVGIVLVMEHMAKRYAEIVKPMKLYRHLPLLVEIPDRHGTGRSKDFITGYIREAIGVKL